MLLFQAYLKQYGDEEESDEEGDEMVHVGSGFYLYKELYAKLYAHQQEGVLWMWQLYKQRKGGILGDDMGLVFLSFRRLKNTRLLNTLCT